MILYVHVWFQLRHNFIGVCIAMKAYESMPKNSWGIPIRTWILLVSSPFYCLCLTHPSINMVRYRISNMVIYLLLICRKKKSHDFRSIPQIPNDLTTIKTEQLVWDFHQDVLQDNKRHVSCSLSFHVMHEKEYSPILWNPVGSEGISFSCAIQTNRGRVFSWLKCIVRC